MVKTPQFQLWLRIETGRIAMLETNFSIPDEHIRVETRVGGRWVETPVSSLT